jgi:cystathionine beta-lyase/cystathionine gamma-synthase
LGPQDSWLLLRGIKTLKVRMDYQQANASKFAEWLTSNKNVESVYYPGLVTHPGYEIHKNQADGAGAVLSFKTKKSETALNILKNIKYAAAAVSLGGVETIVSYPVKMSHASMPKDEREKRGITSSLVRVSLGLEDIEDLIEDFSRVNAFNIK